MKKRSFKNRAAWRDWLEKNHATASEIWLVYYKKHSGKKSVAYEEAVEEALDELALLVDTAGADEVARVTQRRDAPDPATFIGKGKAREIYELAEATDADTVVFDDELSPAQQANLQRGGNHALRELWKYT